MALAIELSRPDIRLPGADDDDDDDEEDGDTDDGETTGASGLAPDIGVMLVPAPLGAACVLTGGDSGDVDGKLENALVCELVDPDDPLPDVASVGDRVLALPMPLGDACLGGAEKTLDDVRLDDVRLDDVRLDDVRLDEVGLDDPPPLLAGCPTIVIGVAIATCGEWNTGAAVLCVDDDVADGG